jgi:LmbE family N-acetylglucosaminyl deacetylase
MQPSKIFTKHTILVVVAHTDDETLGLGGTIAKHVKDGDAVFCMAMTDGVGSRGEKQAEEIKKRVDASNNAGKILGFNWIVGGQFSDNEMDNAPLLEVIKCIEKAKALIKPTIIYTHSAADLNVDHRIVCQATLTAFRPQPGEIWQEIRTFEIPSATEYGHSSVTKLFCPNLYISIKKTWAMKLAALKEYQIEMRNAPHPRSFQGLENLAKYRGNQVGLEYAEAFETIRKIER